MLLEQCYFGKLNKKEKKERKKKKKKKTVTVIDCDVTTNEFRSPFGIIHNISIYTRSIKKI